MSILEPVAGRSYIVRQHGKVIEHFNVARVHGRRIEMAVTAWSALCWQTTRLRWRKMMTGLLHLSASEGITITEEPTTAGKPDATPTTP